MYIGKTDGRKCDIYKLFLIKKYNKQLLEGQERKKECDCDSSDYKIDEDSLLPKPVMLNWPYVFILHEQDM